MKTINITLSVAGLALAFAIFAFFQSTPRVESAGFQNTVIYAATTSTAVAVTSSTRILATTTNALGTGTSYTRVFASICNANANPVVILMNQDKPASLTAANAVIASAAGYSSCYEITDRNQYSGSITASSTNQTSTSVFVTEYVY